MLVFSPVGPFFVQVPKGHVTFYFRVEEKGVPQMTCRASTIALLGGYHNFPQGFWSVRHDGNANCNLFGLLEGFHT